MPSGRYTQYNIAGENQPLSKGVNKKEISTKNRGGGGWGVGGGGGGGGWGGGG